MFVVRWDVVEEDVSGVKVVGEGVVGLEGIGLDVSGTDGVRIDVGGTGVVEKKMVGLGVNQEGVGLEQVELVEWHVGGLVNDVIKQDVVGVVGQVVIGLGEGGGDIVGVIVVGVDVIGQTTWINQFKLNNTS